MVAASYRSDIDGLRAVAVLAVVFFHYGLDILGGGYLGVDIFFVISGYLITNIIVRELAVGEFSVARFYERRFRRILPALVVVQAVCLLVGYFLLSPAAVRDLGQSAVASALFSSNILFYLESGYFERAAELKPLLHTWSLAVEEQFYIFFPLLLMLIARVGARRYARWLIPLAALSLALCLYLTKYEPSAAFYLLPARAWELLTGSFLALGVLPAPTQRGRRELCASLGALMIAVGILGFSPERVTPGVAAILPTFGTALVLYAGAGGKTWVFNFLSLRPLVFVGLISYSLYLWHWPIITYLKIVLITPPSDFSLLLAGGLSFLLAGLSWKFVETPFRRKSLLALQPALFSVSAAVSLSIVAVGAALVMSRGFHRETAAEIASSKADEAVWNHWKACVSAAGRTGTGESLCDLGLRNGNPTFLLWGDSHAQALAAAVDMSAAKARLNGKFAAAAACPPLLDINRTDRRSCNKFNEKVMDIVAESAHIELVILAARWPLLVTGARYKQESGDPVELISALTNAVGEESNFDLFDAGLRRTVDRLRSLGKRVIIVNTVPEVGFDVPNAQFMARIRGLDVNELIAPTTLEYRERGREVEQILSELAAQGLVERVAPDGLLCGSTYCRVAVAGRPLYRDDDHLSVFGTEFVAAAFDKAFARVPPR